MQEKRNNQRIWQYFQQHRVASIVTTQLLVATILGLVLLGNGFGSTILGAFAQTPCSAGDATYVVVSGDTLGVIASRYNTTWQRLTSYNHIGNPNMIYIDQHICVPGRGNRGGSVGSGGSSGSSGSSGGAGTANRGPAPIAGIGNFFAYPQCTWYVNQRYYQLHRMYVPWTSNANAWQWTQRAYDYRWRVSSRPTVGAIVDLQPGVQGASYLGHVGVVERILSNGDFIASNMNWGTYPYSVANVRFTPGYGVTFITT